MLNPHLLVLQSEADRQSTLSTWGWKRPQNERPAEGPSRAGWGPSSPGPLLCVCEPQSGCGRKGEEDLGASLRENYWSGELLVPGGGDLGLMAGAGRGWGPPKAESEAVDHSVAIGDPEKGMGLESLANCPLLPRAGSLSLPSPGFS